MIDIEFDYRTDSNGKDPDIFSPTLKLHHKELWSKQLPNGKLLKLEPQKGEYLVHEDESLRLELSSDTISNSLRHQKRMQHIITQIPAEKLDAFQALGATVGAVTLFPAKKVAGGLTINVARGFLSRIGDRFDLTLECIRRFYVGEDSPLAETFGRYASFFELFMDFDGFVEFFLFQDLVSDGKLKFFLPFSGEFVGTSNPKTVDEYYQYMDATMAFIEARRRRIDQVYN